MPWSAAILSGKEFLSIWTHPSINVCFISRDGQYNDHIVYCGIKTFKLYFQMRTVFIKYCVSDMPNSVLCQTNTGQKSLFIHLHLRWPQVEGALWEIWSCTLKTGGRFYPRRTKHWYFYIPGQLQRCTLGNTETIWLTTKITRSQYQFSS